MQAGRADAQIAADIVDGVIHRRLPGRRDQVVADILGPLRVAGVGQGAVQHAAVFAEYKAAVRNPITTIKGQSVISLSFIIGCHNKIFRIDGKSAFVESSNIVIAMNSYASIANFIGVDCAR